MEITDLEPREVFRFFAEICKIPRPSKNEAAMIEYLKNFGEKRGLKTTVDEAGNVLIFKPKNGKTSSDGVILQSHIDMVCEKNADVEHDFFTDEIVPFVDGEWIKARGTTLGADNGIGVAAMLAILDSKTLIHSGLECLFTVDEETGLTGAFALKPDFLHFSKLINLDSEDDGELFIGCAGGKDTTAFFDFSRENADETVFFFKLEVKGLLGGHSGDDIDKNRANAIKILARFLWQISQKTNLRICEISGGNLPNAIPREASVLAAVPFGFREQLRIDLNVFTAEIEKEFPNEKRISLNLESENPQPFFIDQKTSNALISTLLAVENGVIKMSDIMPGLVETSTNLASVKIIGDKIKVVTSQRSSMESAKIAISNSIFAIFSLAGAKVETSNGYPGWQPNPDSPLAKMVFATFHDLFGTFPKIRAIHAGLECGLFAEKYPNLDMISFGPTMRGVHSPDECLHIGDTLRFWKLLTSVLEKI